MTGTLACPLVLSRSTDSGVANNARSPGRSLRQRRTGVWLLFALLLAGSRAAALETDKSGVTDVKVSRAFFNPSLRQTVAFSFQIPKPGKVDLRILDRDGFVVRTLARDHFATPGSISFNWDGRDDAGRVVADEAYSLKIDLESDGRVASYFPANEPARAVEAQITFHDRQAGTLGYQLPGPSRVHLQAGSSRVDPKTHEGTGPCLKTIVNREPRVGGTVIEHWDGYDESALVYVPDLPHFAVSLAATTLPENSILTIGNRGVSFLLQAANRSGESLLTAPAAKGERHLGLNAFEDTSPQLTVRPEKGAWSETERAWAVPDGPIELLVELDGPSAKVFEREPASVMVFLDDEPLRTVDASEAPMRIPVQLPKKRSGGRVTVNWVSAHGPVAANSLIVKRAAAMARSTAPASSVSGGRP